MFSHKYINKIVKITEFGQKRLFSNRNIVKLKERDMFEDMFPAGTSSDVTDLLNSAPRCVYAGFDPTADSLHVGNLLVLINLLHWQRGGHDVIAVIGGATAKIGDPSGRNSERERLEFDSIDRNVQGVKSNIETIFENHRKYLWKSDEGTLKKLRIVNNESWYSKMSPIDLIGGAGRFLRMGTMLSRSSVQTRLGSSEGMSFTEFSYQLFQSYDWLHLCQTQKCRFQIGGSDQMGNIMSGHDLISKIYKIPVYGFTLPLITSEEGDKFGKSAGNAVWLNRKRSSPFSFYQFWLRLPDGETERMLKLFTFDTLGAVSDLIRRHREKPELRLPQKRLAEQLTILVHGESGLNEALIATQALYNCSIDALSKLDPEDIKQIFEGATITELLLSTGETVMDIAIKAGCFFSTRDAVRIIEAGGFSINHEKTRNPNEILNPTVHKLENNISLLKVGKKRYHIVKWLN